MASRPPVLLRVNGGMLEVGGGHERTLRAQSGLEVGDPDVSRLDAPQGPALGLFLSRLLVEAWGGTIELSAPSEGGCIVTLEVPQSQNPVSAGM